MEKMERSEFKNLKEVQEAMINFVLDLSKKFPNAGKIIGDSLPVMEGDIKSSFSKKMLSYLDEYLLDIMNSESMDGMNGADFEALIVLTGKYIERCNGSSDGRVVFARSLQRNLKLELTACDIIEKDNEILKKVEKNFNGKVPDMDVDPDTIYNIMKEYIAMKKGVKPKEVKGRDKNMESAIWIYRAHSIRRKLEKLEEKRKQVVNEIMKDPPRVSEKYNFLTFLMKERIAELNRCCCDYEQVRTKKEMEALRKKIKHVYCLVEEDMRWVSLRKKAERYFEKYGDNNAAIDGIDPSMISGIDPNVILARFASAG